MFPGALCIASIYAPLATEILLSLLSLLTLLLLLPAVMMWSSHSLRQHFSLTWEHLPRICESSYRLPECFLLHLTDKKIAELIPECDTLKWNLRDINGSSSLPQGFLSQDKLWTLSLRVSHFLLKGAGRNLEEVAQSSVYSCILAVPAVAHPICRVMR